MPTRWRTIFLLLFWEHQKKYSAYFPPFMWSIRYFWKVYLFDCYRESPSILTGTRTQTSTNTSLPIWLTQQALLSRMLDYFVHFCTNSSRRHSTKKDSLKIINSKKGFPCWINFKAVLILWGISNFQSQVGWVEERGAITQERRRRLRGRKLWGRRGRFCGATNLIRRSKKFYK